MTVEFERGKAREALDREEILTEENIEYCLRHWMDDSPNRRNSPASRVKKFLDDVAYLLLRDDPGDTLTRYKILSQGSREISVSSCPAEITHYVHGARCAPADDEREAFSLLNEKLDKKLAPYKKEKPRKEWPPTKFDKIERVKRELPGCTISTYPVDTENIFEHGGVEYQISDDVTQYQPRKTREGLQYDMDRVMVVETEDGELRFYDQSFDRIPDEEIALIEP